MFVARFQQLFYPSWPDARPITQFDHPSGGEYPRFLRALTGDESLAFYGTSPVDDIVRLRYTALTMGRLHSPFRLRQILRAHFGVTVPLEDFATSWLEFAPEDRSMIGMQGMHLGQDLRIGNRAHSISEKNVLHLECRTLEEHRSFLPGRDRQAELKDLVLGYLGAFSEIDVALWLPRSEIQPAQLGTATGLDWTSVMPISQGGTAQSTLVRATQC